MSRFLLVSLPVIINFFPQINHFYYFTSLHRLQDEETHCAHLRDIELKTGRKSPYLRSPHVLLSVYWIGDHEISKLKKKLFASNPEKRTQKQTQKDMSEME